MNEDDIFNYISEVIKNNTVTKIPENASIYKYIKDIINIYFGTYYTLSINSLRQIDQIILI